MMSTVQKMMSIIIGLWYYQNYCLYYGKKVEN
mgnify:CR=1 FL=1|jgi:hypothetical protein